MAFEPYECDRADGGTSTETEPTTSGGVAGQIFLWVAWGLAAAFWAAVATTGVNILQAADNPAMARGGGEAEGGGLQWFAIDVIGGVLVLGGAIAYGLWRWSTRDRRKDAMTEQATRDEYDAIERAGGDDDDIPDVPNAPHAYPSNPPSGTRSSV